MGWERSDTAEEVIPHVELAIFSSQVYCFPLLPSGPQSGSPRVSEEGEEAWEGGRAMVVPPGPTGVPRDSEGQCRAGAAAPGASPPEGGGFVMLRKQSQHFF